MSLTAEAALCVHGQPAAELTILFLSLCTFPTCRWAVAKLHCAVQPAPPGLLAALDSALVGCLSAAAEGDRPNAVVVSSVWYSWGKIATSGVGGDSWVPCPAVTELLWERTGAVLSGKGSRMDSQGISNMLMLVCVCAFPYVPAFTQGAVEVPVAGLAPHTPSPHHPCSPASLQGLWHAAQDVRRALCGAGRRPGGAGAGHRSAHQHLLCAGKRLLVHGR